MDYVIFPSMFTQKAFLDTSIKFNMPIKPKNYVINESYFKEFDNETIDYNFLENIENSLIYDKNILIIGQFNDGPGEDRKNIIKTIKVAAEYVDDKDIGILLKINMGKQSSFFKQKMLSHVRSILDKKERRKIKIIFGNLSKNEMYNLYSCENISCMFSGTRGEGWGLSFLESARCSLPIIATNYSAYKEYLLEDFIKIKYKTKAIKKFDESFFDESISHTWAEFCRDDALLKLDLFFKNIDYYSDRAKKRRVLIKQNYNFNKIIKEYNKFFEIL
jgi:glycosyltransferase involved in cell wall biosynthesis